jgi:Flp pilus assembly protein TadG
VREHDRNRRLRDERGAAVVELSIALIVLVVIIFGIVSYGVILSFKQTMTQAAAEGARAGAMGTATTAAGLASPATLKSLGAFGKTCGSGGLTCTFTVHPCVPGPASAKCIEVDLVYDYEHHPLLPPLPFISTFLPPTLRSNSESQVNS